MRVSNKKDNSIFYKMKESLKRVLSLLTVPENEPEDLEDIIYSSDKNSITAKTLNQSLCEIEKIEKDFFSDSDYKPKREKRTRQSLNKTSINAIKPIDLENVNNKNNSNIENQLDLEK